GEIADGGHRAASGALRPQPGQFTVCKRYGEAEAQPEVIPNEATAFDAPARRRGGGAALTARAAKGDAGGRLPWHHLARSVCAICGRVPSGFKRNQLRRGPKRGDRIPLGGESP